MSVGVGLLDQLGPFELSSDGENYVCGHFVGEKCQYNFVVSPVDETKLMEKISSDDRSRDIHHLESPCEESQNQGGRFSVRK